MPRVEGGGGGVASWNVLSELRTVQAAGCMVKTGAGGLPNQEPVN